MNTFCPDCGAELIEPLNLRHLWIRTLKCSVCPQGEFLEVVDTRWMFPLQRLELGILQKLMGAEESLIHLAVERIRQLDFKTLSIVEFEHTLSGSYDASRRYIVTYPDGSTC